MHRRADETMQKLPGRMTRWLFVLVCAAVSALTTQAEAANINTTIRNTASINYLGLIAPMQASVDSYATIGGVNQGSLVVGFNPDIVRAGGSTIANSQICNTGANALAGGQLTLTPPTGTTLSLVNDPYGNYTVTANPDGSWSVATATIAVGTCLVVPATVKVAPTTPSGTLSLPASFVANGIPIIQGSAPLTVQNVRTPSTITFLQVNTAGVLVPVSTYHAGQQIYVQVQDLDQNVDPYTLQTVTITLVDSITGDTETIVLTETGPNTGIFLGSIASATPLGGATPNNGILSVAQGSKLAAKYIDIIDGTDVSTSAAAVDPFGVVFDSRTGAPINGAIVTLTDMATGLPATVFGDDGISSYPATVTTGGTATDSSGRLYSFPAGNYRFPLVNPGNYRLDVVSPLGFSHPSVAATAAIQLLPGSPYQIVLGSRHEPFVINPGPALHIDIPLDPKPVGLFVQKVTAKTQAAIGDFVPYTVTVENTSGAAATTTAQANDLLPPGFRYVPASARLNGVKIADPLIGKDGRTLTFALGTLAAGGTAVVDYVAKISTNARLGESVNTAQAQGVQLGATVLSNRAQATVTVADDLFTDRATFAGRVFVDENMDALNQEGEPGVAGVRIYLEDGRFVTSDADGQFHLRGLTPGSHVAQVDLETVPAQYELVPLPNSRFAGRPYSQFVDVQGGTLWRTNFRVLRRPPVSMPVTIDQRVTVDGNGQTWIELLVRHPQDVVLNKLAAVYQLPDEWTLVADSGTVNGQPVTAETAIVGLIWPLAAEKSDNVVRFAVQNRGEGKKEAVAWATFVSSGTPEGRTGLAPIVLEDKSEIERAVMDTALHLNFESGKAELTPENQKPLEEVAAELADVEVTRLELVGHADNVRIGAETGKRYATNQILSEARARYVGDWLRERFKLADSVEILSSGRGPEEPLASNKTEEGRYQNRRTELKVFGNRIKRHLTTQFGNLAADAYGEALEAWEKPKSVDAVNVTQQADGILSLRDGQALAEPIQSVRIQLDSRLKPALSVDGKEIDREMIGFKSEDPKTGKTLYTYIGVDFGKPGKHSVQLKGLDPFGNARIDQNFAINRIGEIAAIRQIDSGSNFADGESPVRIRVQLIDDRGTVIQSPLDLELRGGDLLTAATGKEINLDPTPNAGQLVHMDADGWVTFGTTTVSGAHQVIVGHNKVQRTLTTFAKPAKRDWIMVGIGNGAVGYNKLKGATQPLDANSDKSGFWQDGRMAFYAKGQVKGEFLLTAAYDTAKSQGKVGNSVGQAIDPNRYYTVYGDSTNEQFDAASSAKIYLKLERETFYALFGDFDTGLSVTELARYSRSLNGVKSELQESAGGYTAFATRSSQTLVKDELRGDGTSGLYRLSRNTITANSEKVFVETRDRFKSQVVLESRLLARHADYDIDYAAGTLFFKQPVMSKDAALNPIYIRVEYESKDRSQQFTTFGGRGYVNPADGLQVGATYVQQGQIGRDDKLLGADASYQLTDQTEVKVEGAQSNAQATRKANAVKAELLHTGETLRSRLYARQQQDGFGLGQQMGSENGTRKLGAEGEVRLSEALRTQVDVNREQGLTQRYTRDLAQLQALYELDGGGIRAGLRSVRDKNGAGQTTASNQLTAGASSRLTERLTARVDREQNLGKKSQSVDYPTRTVAGLDYLLGQFATLSLTQEFTQGSRQNSEATRIGLHTMPWSGAQLSTSYEQQLGEGGMRAFGNVGLQQNVQLTNELAIDFGYDRSHTIRHPGNRPLNINAPLASGGNDNFSAFSIGSSYRPQGWLWNNRLEYRLGSLENKWGAMTGLQGEVLADLMAAFDLHLMKSRSINGSRSTQATSSLALALRPDFDGWMLLDRFEVRYDNGGTAGNSAIGTRLINNFNTNIQYWNDTQFAFQYGSKWTVDQLGGQKFAGYTDAASVQLAHDISELWDLTLQGGLRHDWRLRQYKPSAGLSVGYNVIDNLWLSLGYNLLGYYDGDFSGSNFTRQGLYMNFRFKVDQQNLADVLKQVQ